VSLEAAGLLLEDAMFRTLESTGDRSARRGWTTAVSFTMQALFVSLLLLVPLLTIQKPPHLTFLDSRLLAPPSPPPAPTVVQSAGHQPVHPSDPMQIVTPPSIPPTISTTPDQGVVQQAPDIGQLGVSGSIGVGRGKYGLPGGWGDGASIAPPQAAPGSSHPMKISHWDEGNLIYRVQPVYPPLARQARIQGTVELRAIISKTGTIENLTVLNGHALLAGAAVEAVRRWRYRPYLLNNEPIEVETEVTVNFRLDGDGN
jgi:periplasmic protein TonB